MSKNNSKKKKVAGSEEEQWNQFVTNTLKRPRSQNRHKLPTDYIEAVADNIFSTNPSKVILVNTLKDFASVLIEKGYVWRIMDSARFKAKQDKHFESDFKKECDLIDDEIHAKSNQPK